MSARVWVVLTWGGSGRRQRRGGSRGWENAGGVGGWLEVQRETQMEGVWKGEGDAVCGGPVR